MKRQKILLLEDDIDLGETVQELLEMHNYEVVFVENGNDTIDATYEQKFDIYIFDINVPDMSGIELLESLRNADDETPTIFISAMIDLNTITKGFEVGADDYLKKPFFPEELLIRVKAKLRQKNRNIKFENLEYNPKTKELFIDEKIVALGEVQECLCEQFLNNINRVVDSSLLMDCLLNPSIPALRVALNKFKSITNLSIKNLRGVGYILEKS